MATSREYAEYIIEMLYQAGYEARFKSAFGEYIFYIDNKPIFLACDERLFTKCRDACPDLDDLMMMQEVELAKPFNKAKPWWVVDPEDTYVLEQICKLVLPVCEPVQPKVRKRKQSPDKDADMHESWLKSAATMSLVPESGPLTEIRRTLESKATLKMHEFTSKLIPTLEPARVLGCKMTDMRAIAKNFVKAHPKHIDEVLLAQPYYLEEMTVQALIVNETKDLATLAARLDMIGPRLNNWASTDAVSPKILRGRLPEYFEQAKSYLESDLPYVRRLGLNVHMQFGLGEQFLPEYVDAAIHTKTEGSYYVEMGLAWYVCTALTKNWDACTWVIEDEILEPHVHNLAIRKCRESRAISASKKQWLLEHKI